MPPVYDIKLKNTFLEFRSVDVSTGLGFRKTVSCPCLLFTDVKDVKPKSEVVEKTSSSEFLPEVASTVSTDSNVPIALKGESRTVVEEKCQAALVESGRKPTKALQHLLNDGKNCISKAALAMQMKLNKQLMQANCCSKPDIFTLVRAQTHRMNAVNLSTALHRIARIGGPRDQKGWSTLGALLNAIEKRAWQELENHGGTMPARCATIIAWSCAKLQALSVESFFLAGITPNPELTCLALSPHRHSEPPSFCNPSQLSSHCPVRQVFRPDLFTALIQVVGLGLGTCKEFEVTNLLWACAQLVKHLASAEDATHDLKQKNHSQRCSIAQPLRTLLNTVETYLQDRLHEVKGQILVSALVSVATLSSLETLSLTRLFHSLCDALVLKRKELTFNNKTQVGVAGRIMRIHQQQVVEAVTRSLSEKCPELAECFRI